MLEKNKDYIEMRVSSTDFAFTQNEPIYLCVEGLVDATNGRFPGPGEDYILISKEKFEALQTENEQLKKKLEEFSPVPGYREFLTALYPEDDVERLVWATEQICGGQVSVNAWVASAKFWKKRYDDIFKLVGFSSTEEIQDYLTNEANCDTLHEAISKLRDEVTYTCEKLASANSENNSWKATAECNSPKELIKKREALEGKVKVLETEAEVYSRALQEWKEGTGCPSPSAAKTLIENGPTHIIYLNDPLGVIAKWEKVTGYDRPEDFLKWKAGIEGIMEAWKDRTGCKYPGEAGELLEKWKDVTGFKTPKEAKEYWTAKLSESGESNELLAREVRSWHEITGFSTPEKCSSYIDTLEEKLEEIKNLIEED